MKTKICEMCGSPICDNERYVKGKLVCKNCFKKHRFSKRMPRTASWFDRW